MKEKDSISFKSQILFTLTLLSILLFLLPTMSAEASNGDIGSGTGGGPTGGGVAHWYWKSGAEYDGVNKTEAWKSFVSTQLASGRAKDEASFISQIQKYIKGDGFKRPDGSYEQLYVSCQKSQYIWWYGDGSNKYQIYYEAGKNTQNPPTGMGAAMTSVWNVYTSMPGTTWGARPGPVLVCSGVFAPTEIIVKKDLTLKANSGAFVYDGKQKTVNGWSKVAGSLHAGHTIEAAATKSRTNVGSDAVPFTYARVKDSSGKNVSTTHYKNITLIKGQIKIINKPKEDDLNRCLRSGTDTVTAIYRNDETIKPVSITGTASDILSEMERQTNTGANALLANNKIPVVGDNKSKWDSWKQQVNSSGQSKAISINLETLSKNNQTVSDIFSQRGGVLDVYLTHNKKKVDVTLCQPQTRTYTLEQKTGEDGLVTTEYKYGEWTNKGEKKIEAITDAKIVTPERYAYQILGVNCNLPGFQNVRNAVQVDSYKLIESVGSGTLKTKAIAVTGSTVNLPLGKSSSNAAINATSKGAFYTDAPTCKNNNLCIVDPTTGAIPTANNDAQNNKKTAPLFAHLDTAGTGEYKDEKFPGYGFPLDKKGDNATTSATRYTDDELVFFRDNENRTARADVWHMRASSAGFITSATAPAKRTVVRVFSGATPDIGITTLQKYDKANQNAQMKFTKFNEMYQFNEHVNKFNIKSQWASNDGKPYKLGVNWVYEVDLQRTKLQSVSNTAITQNVGVTKGVQVACEFLNGIVNQHALINSNPHVNKAIVNSSLNFKEQNSIKVLFNRGISEKRD